MLAILRSISANTLLALIGHDNPDVVENRYRTVVIVLLIAVMVRGLTTQSKRKTDDRDTDIIADRVSGSLRYRLVVLVRRRSR
jgi:hypothetical protein